MKKSSVFESLKIPNFLVIGAARSGTTTLHRWMRQHPEIYIPENKRPEPHFFLKSDEYAKGFEYYLNQYFSNVGDAIAIGEISTSYLLGSHCAYRIHKELPEIRLVMILREPIERAYSNYRVSRQNQLETLSFAEAVRCEQYRELPEDTAFWRDIQPFAYIGRSLYAQQISRYLQYFSPSKLLPLTFDELVERPRILLQQLYSFLGVEIKLPEYDLHAVENQSDANYSDIDPETRRYLAKIFVPDICNLETMLNLDLSKWKQKLNRFLST